MGVSNPAEAVVGILYLLDEVRAKMEGTQLADVPWRPVSPESADVLAGLTHEALARCDDVTDALIVVTVAAVTAASREAGPRDSKVTRKAQSSWGFDFFPVKWRRG